MTKKISLPALFIALLTLAPAAQATYDPIVSGKATFAAGEPLGTLGFAAVAQ
jgi:hypothetical protein